MYRSLILLFCLLLLISAGHSQVKQPKKFAFPDLDLVPSQLAKANFDTYNSRRQKLKFEMDKFVELKKRQDQKCRGLIADSPEDKQCREEQLTLASKLNEILPQIEAFNTEIEEVVYNDPNMDKLSLITYFTIKNDQATWDDFQLTIAKAKQSLKDDKVKIQQELTKLNSKKKEIKAELQEGVVLSMSTEDAATNALKDSLKSPFRGESYKDINAKAEAEKAPASGVVIVSFPAPKEAVIDPIELASLGGVKPPPEPFSLASPKAKSELNKLKEKSYNRFIAHSNGSTVAECLIQDSIINVKELNIIGGEKSLLNEPSLQQLLNNGTVKRLVVWINMDDPTIWINKITRAERRELAENFISYKTKFHGNDPKPSNSKVQYHWILSNHSLNVLTEKDPNFIDTYFKEIAVAFKSN